MDFDVKVFGTYASRQLQQHVSQSVLTIGSDTFSREDLASVSCYRFTAAAILTHAFATLTVDGNRKIRDTRDVFEHVPPEALILPRVGVVSLAVLGAAFEKRRLGGNAPLVTWIQKHKPKDAPKHIVTFSTMKHQAAVHEGAAEERKALKRRKAARRNEAHEIRVDRAEKRAKNGSKQS